MLATGSEGICSINGGIPTEGDCKSWGEPFAEMFYEAIRYFSGLAGSGNATTQFYKTSGNGPDNNITRFCGQRGRSICHVQFSCREQ